MREIDVYTLKYPLFRFPRRDDLVMVINDASELSRCSLYAFTKWNGYFKGQFLVDDLGNEYRVDAETPIESWVRYVKWLSWLINPRVVVKLSIVETGKVYSLEEIKEQLVEDLRCHRIFYSSGDSLGAMRHAVARAESFSDLIKAWKEFRED